jgi:predicted GIY-YIG superfamily endonuclease
MFYVYCITSQSSPGRRYIGFTKDLKQRVADHNEPAIAQPPQANRGD